MAISVCALVLGLWTDAAIAFQRFAPVTSDNFVVYAPDPAFARRVAQEAERYRRELSIDWLGYEIQPWQERCPISVEIGLHAGGETSFAFLTPPQGGRGYPTGWQMKIFGPPERLLDAVLPHEVTHTIFATHFGQPLPRWADEGACTTVEHISERKKNHNMLIGFLGGRPSRGIPFNRMFTMRNYPNDILPLYAQGYSLAKFLIRQKGRRHFINYLSDGLTKARPGIELAAWDNATDQFYGYRDLSELQLAWQDWVASGAAEENSDQQLAIAVRPKGNAADRAQFASASQGARFIAPDRQTEPNERSGVGSARQSVANLPINEGWYAKQMKSGPPQSSRRIAASRQTIGVEQLNQQGTTPESDNSVVLPPNPSQTIWR